MAEAVAAALANLSVAVGEAVGEAVGQPVGRPIILLLGLISEMIFESNKCKSEKTPVSQITNKALILMSVFLYTEYTVKCIPMVKLTMDSIFQFKKVGEIIKMVVGFMFMTISSLSLIHI